MTGQTVSRYPQDRSEGNAEASREQFADGSALVTYPNGNVLILESNLARESAVAETRDSERGVWNWTPTPHPTLSPFEAERVTHGERVVES